MNDQNLHDAVLAVRCQLGEKDAWEALVDRWHPRLWRFISRMLSDQTAAEDVLQIVWLRVVRSLLRLRDPERLAAWLYGIARFAVADQLREQYRRPPAGQLVEVSESDDAIELLDIAGAIETGLSRLHPSDREAVVLYYLEQRPVGEVAEICGVPSGTVKSRLHRARCVLRETLASEELENAHK